MVDELCDGMTVAKETLESMLAEAGAAKSRVLPEPDAKAFPEWLREEVGHEFDLHGRRQLWGLRSAFYPR